MNYYEHHIGDYAEATAHLSFVEDAAYSRLIRKYYAQEKPLPVDIKAVQRLIGARAKDEREAVETVLQEFFTLEQDGWHNHRCDDEIAKFHESAPDREAKRENERERQKRTRERRKQIFEALREVGVIPPYDAPMSHLNSLLSQHDITLPSQPVTRDVTHPVTRDATATQTPVPNPQLIPPPLSASARPPADSTVVYAMEAGWQPSPQFLALAKVSGLPVKDTAAIEAGTGEFIAYWLTQPHVSRTAIEWDNALVKSLKREIARLQAQPSRPSKTQRPEAKPWDNAD